MEREHTKKNRLLSANRSVYVLTAIAIVLVVLIFIVFIGQITAMIHNNNVSNMKLAIMTACMLALVLVIVMIVFIIMMKSAKKRTAREAEIKTRSEFLSSMSHEIRTPIIGLIGLNDMMRRNREDAVKMERLLDQQEKSAEYLLAVVNDILDMGKLESGRIEYSYAPVNIEELLLDSCMLQSEVYTQRGVELQTDLNISDPWIRTDALRVQQVIMNVLGNASKFTPNGGTVVLSASQHCTVDPDGNEPHRIVTVIKVTDTGIGMSQKFLETIWDPFTQERSNKVSGHKGTGLGLSISHDLIVGLGGTISVESELGHGSTFTISLPTESADPSAVSSDGLKPLSGLSILIAEDNELNAQILIESLKQADAAQIKRAHDGLELLEMLHSAAPNSIDIILMDAQMPRLNGYETSFRIRELEGDYTDVIILAASANSPEEHANRARRAGMDGCLTKPISTDQIAEAYAALTKARKEGKRLFYIP